MKSFRFPLAVAFALLLAPALAQQQTQRIAGSVDRFDGHVLIVHPYVGGTSLTVMLPDNVAVFGVSKATLADVTPGSFIGVGAKPQTDGSQRAVQVTVFAESQRGLGEGFRPWDARAGHTMTNATVAETVAGVEGQVVTVKYKDGEKKIVIPADAAILAYSVGDKSELMRGANVAIVRAIKKADGTFEADRVNIGHGGVVPR